jgi:hypothetical protein
MARLLTDARCSERAPDGAGRIDGGLAVAWEVAMD